MIPLLVFFGLCTLAVSACVPFAKELPLPPHEISAFQIVGPLSRVQFIRGPLDGHYWSKPAVLLSGQSCVVRNKSTGRLYLYRAIITGWGTSWVYSTDSAEGVAADHTYEWEFSAVAA